MKAVAISLLLLCAVALLNASGGSAQTSLSLKRHPHKYLVDHQARVHRSQLKTPPRFRAGSVIPLSGGLLSLGYYYVPITVGTPAVEFNVLLDTGSSNLALSSDACDSTCKSSSAPFYSPDQSSTGSPLYFHTAECSACNPDGSASNCAFGQPYPSSNGQFCGYGISYGGGSSYVSGYIGYDDVTFGGYTVNASIIVMTSQLPSGSLTSAPISGILGLAHEMNAVNPTWAPTIFGQIAQQYQLTNLFGLCLNSSTGGSLDLGAYESSRFSGSLQWVPVVEQRWYNMQMLDVLVGSTSLGMPTVAYAFNNDQIGTFIDSGTSALLFGPSAMGSLTSIFQSQYCSLPLVCGSQTIFTGACISDSQMQGYLSKFPALTFVFAGENGQQVKLSIGADSYFFHQNGQYCLAISAVPGIGAVLGDVFMENFYIVHDRANRRIGFAPVTNC